MQRRNGILKLLAGIILAAALICVAIFGLGKEREGRFDNIKLGLDLAGGVSITYETVKDNPTATEMADTKEKLRLRAEMYSTEAEVYQEGDNRICVDIPDVTDANEVLRDLGTPGSLEFRLVDGTVIMTGEQVKNAYGQGYQSNGISGGVEYVVVLELTNEGRTIFAEQTAANIGKRIYIYYDKVQISAPLVTERIDSETCTITGMAGLNEANALATTIRIGAIPLELRELRSDVVGAKLGETAITTSILAALIGLVLVMILMIVLYRIPGVAAALALLIYVAMMIVVLSGFRITLTLPGIAGMILSIGMAVDANVIIFARIKEEIGQDVSVRSAIKNGFSKAMSAIVDGNVTTLIAAFVLYALGSGTVRGFAQTLAVGIILSMITALFVTRLLLVGFYEIGIHHEKFYGSVKTVKRMPVLSKKLIYFCVSGAVILAAVVIMIVNASKGNMMNYSIDFVGGTSVTIEMKEDMSLEQIQTVVEPAIAEVIHDTEGNITSNKVIDSNQIIVKTKTLEIEEREALTKMLKEKFGVEEEGIQMQNISATIGAELRKDALIAVLVATLGMLIYIWFRFKNVVFAASSVLALLHDVMVVIFFYLILQWSVGTTFIACILTIVGYSINATIVIFDRIRENLNNAAVTKKYDQKDIVDLSISQTMTRSIYTSLTTLIMVVVLAIVGVASIREFAYPLIVGIICGGYSSVCLAGSMWYMLNGLRKPEEE